MGGMLTNTSKKGYPEKYLLLRDEIKNGDLILYRGTSFLAKSIQYFDKAYYNHIGVAWRPEGCDRVLTLDMWSGGLDCIPLSRRMNGYGDFCILRPKVKQEIKNAAVGVVLEDWDGRDIKYDNTLLLRIAIIKKTGIDISGLGKKDKYICSEFAQRYCDLIGLRTYASLNLISPEDFRRFIDENFELLYDDGPVADVSCCKKNDTIKCLFSENYKLLDK